MATPLLGLAVIEALVLLLLPVLATWSRVAPARDADALVLASTPMGAVPVQIVVRLMAGTDALVIVLIALTMLG